MPSLLASAEKLRKLAPSQPAITAAGDRAFIPEFPLEAWTRLGLQPKPHQAAAHASQKRFNVDVWHRRAGKTISKVMKLLERAVSCPFPNGRYAYLGPTYSQVQDIAWAELAARAEQIPGAVKKDSLMAVLVPTLRGDMARIRLYGVDSPKQRLRGSYLDGVVVDEFQHIPLHVWTNQVRPMLADGPRRGVDRFGRANQWADFIGTPLGRNHLFRFYDRADRWQRGEEVTVRREDGTATTSLSNEWGATLLPVTKTGMIHPDELREIEADLSPTEFAQEFMCDFEVGVAGAILRLELEELRAAGRITDINYNPNLPVHTCWDLGWNDATVVWFYQMAGGAPLFIDFLMAVNASIPVLAERVREKGYRLGTNYFPHDVSVHETGEGKTRRALFRQHGIVASPVAKKSLPDGIAALRRFLKMAYFDREKCADGLDLLAIYRREKDEKTGLVREEPVHDMASHVADALRSGAIGTPRWTYGGNRPINAILNE